jgi:CRISPR type I-E-associated protein CasB/Cse2
MNNDVKTIIGWWGAMQPDKEDDRAALAHLRRAGTILQLCMLPQTLDLCRKLDGSKSDLGKTALIAGVLAYIRKTANGKFAGQLGSPAERPKMAPLRFQRLIEAATPDEQLTAFRRAVIQNDREANVYDLAESLLHWGDARRQSWLYDYYQTSNPKSELETVP